MRGGGLFEEFKSGSERNCWAVLDIARAERTAERGVDRSSMDLLGCCQS